MTGLQTAGRGGAFGSGFKLDNLFNKRGGGSVGGGLDSLPIVYRQQNARVGSGAIRTIREAEIERRKRMLPKQTSRSVLENNIIALTKANQEAESVRNALSLLKRKSLGNEQITARDQLTSESLGKLSAGADKTFDPDFGRAAKAVIGASPTQGLVGLLGLAGAEAFEGQDIKVRERDKIKRDVAKIESDLKRTDLAKAQALATTTLTDNQKEAGRKAQAAAALKLKEMTKGQRVDAAATEELAKNVKIEKDIVQTDAAFAKIANEKLKGKAKVNAADVSQVTSDVVAAFKFKIKRNKLGEATGYETEAGTALEAPQLNTLLQAISDARSVFINVINNTGNKGNAFDAVTAGLTEGGKFESPTDVTILN